MIETVVKTLKGTGTKVFVVTLLTSLDKEESMRIYSRSPEKVVKNLASIGNEAGADGFVCSPHEVKMLREIFPDKTLEVPGIRSEGADKGDQKRVDTPAGAIRNGATHIIMGRQIFGAPDPALEVQRLLEEELKFL